MDLTFLTEMLLMLLIIYLYAIVGRAMFGAGPGWKDEAQRDADVDKFILETAGAHTFYGDRLQDVEEEQRTMARAPR